LGGGLDRLGSQFRTSIEALSDKDAAAVEGAKRSQQIAERVGDSPTLAGIRERYETEGLLGAAKQAVGDLPRALAAQIPQLGAMAAGAKLGAMAGAPFGGPVGAGVGAALGAGATLLPQFFGANLERQAEEQQAAGKAVNVDRGTAAVAATGQTALEAAGTAFILGKRLVKGLLGIADDAALATPAARQSFLRAVTSGAARGTWEVPVEVVQQAIERAQAGLDVLSDDAIQEYGEAVYQALLVGPVIGATGNVIQRSRDNKNNEDKEVSVAPIDELRRKAAEAEAAEAQKFRILSSEELDALAESENGYTALSKYIATLEALPENKKVTAAKKQAYKKAAELNIDLVEEIIERRKKERALLKQAQEEQKANDAAVSRSAFATAEPDMFGEFVPRVEPEAQEGSASAVLTPEAVRAIGFAPSKSPNSIYSKLLGKDISDPGEATYVREVLEGYKNRSSASTTTVAKIDKFLETLPKPAAQVNEAQGELDLVPPPRVRAKGERNGRQSTSVDSGRAVSVVEQTEPTASVESLGVAVEPNERDTATPTDTAGVGVFEPATPVNNTGQGQQSDTIEVAESIDNEPPSVQPSGTAFTDLGKQLDTTVARLESQRAEKELETLKSDIARIKQALKDIRDARDALKTRGGAILPADQPAYDEATKQLLQYQEILAALVPRAAQLKNAINSSKTKPGRAPKGQKASLSDYPDTSTPEKARQEVIEAVGVYNRPNASPELRRDATDFLFAVANGDIPDYNSARDFAKRALRFGVDPKDLTKPQQLAYDSLTKDVKDDDTPWGSYLYQKGGAYDTPIFEQQRIARILRNMPNVRDIASWIARTAPDPTYRRIALKVSDRIRAMERDGFIFSLEVKNNMPNQLGYVFFSPNEGNKHARIAIRAPGDGPYSGANYTTILHELIHAVTASAIRSDANKVLRDRLQAQLDHINEVIKNAKDNGIIEQVLQGRMYEIFKNVDELVAWTLSDPHARNVLRSIPAKDNKARSVWQKILDAIRAYFGLSNKQESVLSDIMSNAEALLLTDPINDVTMGEVGLSLVGQPLNMLAPSQAGPDLVGSRDERGYIRRVYDRLGGNKAIGLRVHWTDSLASVGNKFATAYGGKVRDSEGNINPEVLLSQALQSDRFSLAAQKFGYITIRDGMPIAEDLVISGDLAEKFPDLAGQKVSYLGVMSEITAEARRQGVDRATLQKRIDEMLAGRREHYLYKLQDQGKGPFTFGLTREQAVARNAQFEADPFAKRISQMLDAIRFKGIDFLVDTGRISKDTATEWKNNTGYIPFDRINDSKSLYEAMTGSNRGLATYRSRGKFTGSEKLTDSPIEEMSGLIDWMVTEGMKNNAVKRALDDLTLLNDAKMVPNMQASPDEQRTVKVFKDGVPKFFFVEDPLDVIAFSIAPNSVSDVVRGFQKFSQVLRAGVTATPPFVLKQVADDIVRIYAYSELKNPGRAAIEILKNFPKNWFNEAFRRNSAASKEYERRGIVGSFDFTEFGNLKNILEESGAKSRTLGGKLLHFMEAGARAQDMTVRQAIYDQIMRETNDPVYAESQAREIINFSRRGSARMMDTLIRTIPFFNAYARGMDKLLVAATNGRGVGKVTGQANAMFRSRMLKLTALGLMYALVMQNDEEYNKLDDYVRDRNWVLPFGSELGYKYVIPVPEELAFLFKAIPERVVQYYRLQGAPEERDGLRILGEIVASGGNLIATPNLAPQALRSLIENLANYSFFLGRPLESVAMQKMDKFERYTMSTSEAAKDAAAWLTEKNLPVISPIKLDNLIRGLMGTTGAIMLEMYDSLMHPNRTDRPLNRSLSTMLTGASAYVKDPVGSRYTTVAYELKEEADVAKATYERLLKRDPQKATEYLKNNYGVFQLGPAIKNLTDKLSEMQATARWIDSNKQLPPEDRRQAIDLIRYRQQEIAREALALRAEAERLQAQMRSAI
jgi:hypothetical protein